jgi:hypothetical protein
MGTVGLSIRGRVGKRPSRKKYPATGAVGGGGWKSGKTMTKRDPYRRRNERKDTDVDWGIDGWRYFFGGLYMDSQVYELIGVLQRTLDNYHAGLYPNLKYIDEDAIVAIIEKLKETRRYAKLLKAAERVDKHLTLDWLIDDTYVSLVDEQYGEKSELRESVIALIEALPEKEGKKCQKKST